MNRPTCETLGRRFRFEPRLHSSKLKMPSRKKKTKAPAKETPQAKVEETAEVEDGLSAAEVGAEDNEGKDEPSDSKAAKEDEKADDDAVGGEAEKVTAEDVTTEDNVQASEQPEDKPEKARAQKGPRRVVPPPWATLSSHQQARLAPASQAPRPKIDDIVIEAIKVSGGASSVAVRRYVTTQYPSLQIEKRSYLLRQALRRGLQRGLIRQVTGKGASGSYQVIDSAVSSSSRNKDKGDRLTTRLPKVFTLACSPKEASYSLIRKYLLQHFPSMALENRPAILKQALQRCVDKGSLEQITGRGASGTFQLLALPSSQLPPLEAAISTAIIAMNEPKSASMTALKKLLQNEPAFRGYMLKRSLKKLMGQGWVTRISGKGFSGSFQLAYPYYPRYVSSSLNRVRCHCQAVLQCMWSHRRLVLYAHSPDVLSMEDGREQVVDSDGQSEQQTREKYQSTGKTSRQIAMVKNKDATSERVISKRSSRVRKAKAVAHKSKSKSVGAKAAVAARLKPGVRPGMRRRSRK
uniref:Heterochromatin protein 1-binding protein 3 n=2 Tax=Eptatretus burgeri TaxID=7764 RepID=A0A8C4WSP8_EPTBU